MRSCTSKSLEFGTIRPGRWRWHIGGLLQKAVHEGHQQLTPPVPFAWFAPSQTLPAQLKPQVQKQRRQHDIPQPPALVAAAGSTARCLQQAITALDTETPTVALAYRSNGGQFHPPEPIGPSVAPMPSPSAGAV